MNKENLVAFLNDVTVIVPHSDDEAMQVDLVDPEEFGMYATGEESGEQYYIDLNDFNVNEYLFYRLQLVEPPKE